MRDLNLLARPVPQPHEVPAIGDTCTVARQGIMLPGIVIDISPNGRRIKVQSYSLDFGRTREVTDKDGARWDLVHYAPEEVAALDKSHVAVATWQPWTREPSEGGRYSFGTGLGLAVFDGAPTGGLMNKPANPPQVVIKRYSLI